MMFLPEQLDAATAAHALLKHIFTPWEGFFLSAGFSSKARYYNILARFGES